MHCELYTMLLFHYFFWISFPLLLSDLWPCTLLKGRCNIMRWSSTSLWEPNLFAYLPRHSTHNHLPQVHVSIRPCCRYILLMIPNKAKPTWNSMVSWMLISDLCHLMWLLDKSVHASEVGCTATVSEMAVYRHWRTPESCAGYILTAHQGCVVENSLKCTLNCLIYLDIPRMLSCENPVVFVSVKLFKSSQVTCC